MESKFTAEIVKVTFHWGKSVVRFRYGADLAVVGGRGGGGYSPRVGSEPWRPSISDLSTAEVRSLAAALGLVLDADDAAEVTHRLNAFLHALTPLVSLPLVDVEPYPIDPRSSV